MTNLTPRQYMFAIIRTPISDDSNVWYSYTQQSLETHGFICIRYTYSTVEEYLNYGNIVSVIPNLYIPSWILIIDAGLIMKYTPNTKIYSILHTPIIYLREIRYNNSFHRIILFNFDDIGILLGQLKPKIYPIRRKFYPTYPYFVWASEEPMHALKLIEYQITPKYSYDYIHLTMLNIWDKTDNIHNYIDALHKKTHSKQYKAWILFINCYLGLCNIDLIYNTYMSSILFKNECRVDLCFMVSIFLNNTSQEYLGITEFYNKIFKYSKSLRLQNDKHVFMSSLLFSPTIYDTLILNISIYLNKILLYDSNRNSPAFGCKVPDGKLLNIRDICDRLIIQENICSNRLFKLQYLYSDTKHATIIRHLTNDILNAYIYNLDTQVLIIAITSEYLCFTYMDPKNLNILSQSNIYIYDIIKDIIYDKIEVIRGDKSWWLKIDNYLMRLLDTNLNLYETPYKILYISNTTVKGTWIGMDNSIVTSRVPHISMNLIGDELVYNTDETDQLRYLYYYENPFIEVISYISSNEILCRLSLKNVKSYKIPYRILSYGYKLSHGLNIVIDNKICDIITMCKLSNKYLAILKTKHNENFLACLSISK